jgi:hypothetical protein
VQPLPMSAAPAELSNPIAAPVAVVRGASSDPWKQWAILAAALVLVVVAIVAVTVVLTRGSGDNNEAGAGQPTGAGPGSGDPTTGGPTTTTPTTPTTSTPSATHATHTGKPPVHVRAPFTSAALYAFAKPFFRPASCFSPGPDDAPLAVRIRDKELVKCGQPGDLYTGTFWCKGAVPSFMADRRLYLSEREGPLHVLTGKPTGSDRPVDGVQRAYLHVNSAFPRVYWDSRDSLCAAEIQGNDGSTMTSTISFWRTGR